MVFNFTALLLYLFPRITLAQTGSLNETVVSLLQTPIAWKFQIHHDDSLRSIRREFTAVFVQWTRSAGVMGKRYNYYA